MKVKLAITVRKWAAASLATMLALSILSGCQPVFMSKEIYTEAYSKTNMLPARVEDSRCPITSPISAATPAPPTVLQPERKPKHLTLQYAMALALENGMPSGRAFEGKADTNLAGFNGPGSLIPQTDRIRVLALNPAISSAAIEASLARFDAVWVTSMNWTNTDNLQQGLASFTNGHGANFNSSIVKAFADGSVANVSFITSYTNLNVPPTGAFDVLNPQYSPRLSFGIETPLWRDSGVDINQLLSRLPSITGQSLTAGVAQAGYNGHQGTISSFLNGPTEGILISKLRFDQSRAEFERNVHLMIKNVEIAYWNLYNKYGQLYSFEENLRLLQKAYQENYNKNKAGGGKLKPHQFYQSQGQFEEFRANRIQAVQEVLDAERDLRGILGLPMEDGERLIPITPPTLAEMKPDWDHCLQDALNLRPELLLARDNLRYHQYLLTIQKNGLKPDLRFYAKYEPVGFGSTLTGSGTFTDGTGTERTTNAFNSLRTMNFADYQFGLYLNVPIGQRAEYAAVRAGRLQLAQSYYFLRDQEDKAVIYLTQQYQEVNRWYKQIGAHRSERQNYGEALKKYLDLIIVGSADATYGSLDFLSIQRSYAAALVKEYNAIAEYNNSLARLEWAKGTTLRYNNVHVSEGQLPACAQVNAVEYEKERARALALKQRPDSLSQPGRKCVNKESDVPSSLEMPPVNALDSSEPPANPLVGKTSGMVPRPLGRKWVPALRVAPGIVPAKLPVGPISPVPNGSEIVPVIVIGELPNAPAPLPKLPERLPPL